MLNIIENIDPINYIIQDVLNNINGLELTPRNNFYIGEGYSLDIQEVRKNSYKLKVRTNNLQDLCNIAFDKKNLIIRYSPEFFFVQEGAALSTNLFEGLFSLEELPNAFRNNSTVFGLGVEFDHATMMETIELCRRIRDDFLRKIATQK
ncbi:hypothetical protein pEaSNUABM50_00050 [Erwinia phage pEa_SNUABM_50]|uniref:Uncharacterized protein n=4 Tax=Eneladusvirus BF TaxID=2560751 RepID=A0A7L8ZM45_9CAUD|nr:hypothetical protein FDH34_gp052 [Serratia phage BF]QOI70990.1 hypothetical protein pEaSNUABM12_00052 [Erwinia phage pEa_SNUABM_12]QOI71535.1 hypothetical protein pEaSNUABM47_00051 [Erwinia phage pEa_SNUABM_47]QOI72074.1 hypothetical protein pEaSNUABM50_00050 [Erwinia phage pEa_SNUABM_50]QXO11199.1 hypothetical protein pEaSNUABM19_00053 [Erwinia phage pEa_SNUABM_19]QXO11747.1 hypothetical protein pEaSNUABM44_00051 [Erwinia phage pEa_SNUABM_44]QXO12298.1 hypothetical protein pEaSNUABM49_000